VNKILILIILTIAAHVHSNENRVVVITGASQGVGLATSELLAKNGFIVYGTSRNPKKVSHLESDNLHFIYTDLVDEKSVNSSIKMILKNEGHIDILINNAGYALVGPVESLSPEQIQDQLEINFLAPIRFIQAVIPIMRRKNSGHIINISSINAVNTPSFGSLYASSKAALESLSESLYIELNPFNINVSIIEPGFLSTHFSQLVGEKEIFGNPYGAIMRTLEESVQERAANPELIPSAQTAKEMAQFIWGVINSPNPKLRYQTSREAEMEVSKKIHDLNGDLFINECLNECL
jgi:NAD(P)-dependent dehydrogenase (short-subunit alcohol dehydrogenase family)